MTNWEIPGSCSPIAAVLTAAPVSSMRCRRKVTVVRSSSSESTGRFGDAQLDGLNLAFAIAWPGAVHQGHGTMQPIIDEKGTEAQRAALLSILPAKTPTR